MKRTQKEKQIKKRTESKIKETLLVIKEGLNKNKKKR